MTEPAVTAAKLLTPEQVAQRWAVPRSQVYRLARDGRLPCVKLGRYTRFLEDRVERFERSGGTDGE
jgi:excisionase family DNA binding protein